MRRSTMLLVVIALSLIAGFGSIAFYVRNRPPAIRDQVVIGVSYDPVSAPIFVALKKGFFRDEGIDASLLMHTTGKAALASMEEGRVQFATIADTVLMFAAMDKKKIVSIATMTDSSRHHRVLGLKSRGVTGAKDLAGKKIGVPAGTSGEFFLYSLLLFNGIPPGEASIVDVPPEKMMTALKSGAVDAVTAWPPTANRIIAEFGNKVTIVYDDGYLMTWNMVTPAELPASNPELMVKLLAALRRAQREIAAHPDDAIAITAEACRMIPHVLKQEWTSYNFTLRLGEGLLINMEDQARWAMKMHYKDSGRMPDFNNFIYADALRKIDPAAVAVRGKASP